MCEFPLFEMRDLTPHLLNASHVGLLELLGRSGGRSSCAICGFAQSSWRVSRNEQSCAKQAADPGERVVFGANDTRRPEKLD